MSINVTRDNKNREKLFSTAVRVMAIWVIGHFHSETQIICLWLEGPITWVQYQLGFVGDLYSYQKTPFKKFCDEQFSRKLRTYNLSFMGHCMSCVWVERSKLIWVVNPMIVYGYVMSKWKNFYWDGNRAHFQEFWGFEAIVSSDLNYFFQKCWN